MSKNNPILPGNPEWPAVWATYRRVQSLDKDIGELRRAGVGLISTRARTVEDARKALEIARAGGMKYHIYLPDITERAELVRDTGQDPVPALMIAGVYKGKAIDRHVFSFSSGKHRIIIEPPVYSRDLPYTTGSGGDGKPKDTEPVGHYFPDMGSPVRAEVVVPLKEFDGRAHLKIIPAAISEAPPGAKLESDSVARGLPRVSEIRDRKLYQLEFDLAGLEGAMLDKVGLVVYWEYGGSENYWMFGRGEVSAAAESTRDGLRREVRSGLQPWIDANGGTFPSDVVIAVRYGDECWHVTGHLNGPAVSYPLWDFSEPSIAAFKSRAGDIEYPRTWGFPEIYGADAYAWWMYSMHEQCASLLGVVRDEVVRIAPGLLVFRNQTRAGVFALTNEHDGSGQELLVRNLDIVHLDPYPVSGTGYKQNIPRDMSYLAGLSRRYARPLVPWLQAHTYSYPDNLIHPGPDDVERMCQEHYSQGVDGIVWLGWGRGFTFPDGRRESWSRAVEFHKRLTESLPPKPKARLAVLRPYRTRALSSICDGRIRNPGDWLLQQLLEVWAVWYGEAYDVFEIPPVQTAREKSQLAGELERYEYVVSTEPHDRAWVIGEGSERQEIDPTDADPIREQFERDLLARGWLTGERSRT